MVFMCGASLPSPVIKLLARYEDDADSLRAAGIEYACRQLEDLAANGADGLHIYTMNRADVAGAAMTRCAPKQAPWHPPSRRRYSTPWFGAPHRMAPPRSAAPRCCATWAIPAKNSIKTCSNA